MLIDDGKRTRRSGERAQVSYFVLSDIDFRFSFRPTWPIRSQFRRGMATAFDPRAETLSPWLWIPIFVVALALFVFLSISRREIIFAAYDHSLALSVSHRRSLPRHADADAVFTQLEEIASTLLPPWADPAAARGRIRLGGARR